MLHSARLTHETSPALVLLRPLTNARRMWEAGLPLTTRGVASAFSASPELEEVLPHILLSTSLPAFRAAGGVRILAGYDVRESVRPRRLRVGRGASCPAFFCALNYTRYPMTNTPSPVAYGPELTTATAAACRRAFRRRSALRLPEDRTELPSMPEDCAALPEADQPTAAPAPTLHAQAVAARDGLRKAASAIHTYRQALADVRQVADALLPRICSDGGYASPIARPFIGDVLAAKFHDLEQQLTNAHDAALGQATLLCRLARELETAGEVRHA